MEDTYQIMHFDLAGKKGTFYGVFDGHGGKDVSHQLVDIKGGLFPFLIEAIKKESGVGNGSGNGGVKKEVIVETIRKAFLEYDHKMYLDKFKAGSTAAVILHYDDFLYTINVGDSRSMIFTEDDKISQMTQDHKPWLSFERNRIYRAGHYVNPFKIYRVKTAKTKYDNGDIYHNPATGVSEIYLFGKWDSITKGQYHQIEFLNKDVDTHRVCNSLALSRALGDFYLKLDKDGKYMGEAAAVSPEPDIQVIDLRPHKGKKLFLLIGSDGYWDVSKITDNFRKQLKTDPNPAELCKNLVKNALVKGSQDNVSVIFDQFVI
jgi:serine/threonine protein phosphatase PrpC